MSYVLYLLIHGSTRKLDVQITHTISRFGGPALSNDIWFKTLCIDGVPSHFINTHILVSKEFMSSCQNGVLSNESHVTCQFPHCQSTQEIPTTIYEIIVKCIYQ